MAVCLNMWDAKSGWRCCSVARGAAPGPMPLTPCLNTEPGSREVLGLSDAELHGNHRDSCMCCALCSGQLGLPWAAEVCVCIHQHGRGAGCCACPGQQKLRVLHSESHLALQKVWAAVAALCSIAV